MHVEDCAHRAVDRVALYRIQQNGVPQRRQAEPGANHAPRVPSRRARLASRICRKEEAVGAFVIVRADGTRNRLVVRAGVGINDAVGRARMGDVVRLVENLGAGVAGACRHQDWHASKPREAF